MIKLLSIVIVSFNSKNFLEPCLKSLSKNEIKSKTEIIVVDNSSIDGTFEYLKNKYPDIKIINNKHNLGFAKANNQGIKKSKGKYVLLLNPDTIIPSSTLAYMINFMETHQSAGISTCFVRLTTGDIDDACHRGFPTPWNAFCHFIGLSALFPNSLFLNGYHLGYRNLNKTHNIDSCTGAFMLIRRSVGEKLHWLDEDYFWYGEDIDFCYRVKKFGFGVYFIPQVGITHFKGVSSGIKKHSESISSASFETKIKATKARFAVMRIFYKKHYQNLEGKFLMPLIFTAIKIKEQITLLNLKIKNYANRI